MKYFTEDVLFVKNAMDAGINNNETGSELQIADTVTLDFPKIGRQML